MLRTCVLCCAVAGLVGLTVGCNPGSPTKPGVTKDEAVIGLKTRMDDADKKAAALKEKADKAAAGDKDKLEARVKDAAAKREAAAKKLDELKAAPADKSEAVRKDAEAAVKEYEKAVAE
jgi:hypothetical protein